MNLKSILTITGLSLLLWSCGQPTSSVSSLKTNNLVDTELADEIRKMREESNNELHRFESRLGEIFINVNQGIFESQPELRNKYTAVLDAQMHLIQSKAQFDLERNLLIDKLLSRIAEAKSKDEVKQGAEMLVEEMRQMSSIYLESYQKLFDAMQETGIETPLMDELGNNNQQNPDEAQHQNEQDNH